MGRDDEALTNARGSIAVDPLGSAANLALGSVLVFNRCFEDAIAQRSIATELMPRFWFAHNFRGHAYLANGGIDGALEILEKGAAFEPSIEILGRLGHAYAVAGQTAKANGKLARLDAMATDAYGAPHSVALIRTGLGDLEAACSDFGKAFDRSYVLAVLLNTNVPLDPLRVDPRLLALKRRVGLLKIA